MKKCIICNKEFWRYRREAFGRFERRQTCSSTCTHKFIGLKRREKFIVKKCKKCGKDIPRRERRRIFCGQECAKSFLKRENNPMWKGGIKKHGEYTQVHVGREHPFSDVQGYIMQHRLVIENHLREIKDTRYLLNISNKYYLNPIVKVHHKNHIKNDNRIENLVPMLSQKEHFHFNWCPQCPHCVKSGELLENPAEDNQQPS